MGSSYSYEYDYDYDSDFDYDSEFSDCDGGHSHRRKRARRYNQQEWERRQQLKPVGDSSTTVVQARRERYEDADPDEYSLVPAKPKGGVRAYEDPARKAIMSAQDYMEREMGQLKVDEQKIKNKIANERLAYDVQKRQQAKEMHDIKVAVIKKYPNIVFNTKPASE